MQIEDLSADLMARPFARVVPLKGARAYSEGRVVPFTPATARAVVAYLRVPRMARSTSSTARAVAASAKSSFLYAASTSSTACGGRDTPSSVRAFRRAPSMLACAF
jgi:hypothetical protein